MANKLYKEYPFVDNHPGLDNICFAKVLAPQVVGRRAQF